VNIHHISPTINKEYISDALGSTQRKRELDFIYYTKKCLETIAMHKVATVTLSPTDLAGGGACPRKQLYSTLS
jgi:hypothetical protein